MTNVSLKPISTGLAVMRDSDRDIRSRPFLAALLMAAVTRFKAFANCLERRKQRMHLASLEDHMLRDIGISRWQAWREASRWF